MTSIRESPFFKKLKKKDKDEESEETNFGDLSQAPDYSGSNDSVASQIAGSNPAATVRGKVEEDLKDVDEAQEAEEVGKRLGNWHLVRAARVAKAKAAEKLAMDTAAFQEALSSVQSAHYGTDNLVNLRSPGAPEAKVRAGSQHGQYGRQASPKWLHEGYPGTSDAHILGTAWMTLERLQGSTTAPSSESTLRQGGGGSSGLYSRPTYLTSTRVQGTSPDSTRGVGLAPWGGDTPGDVPGSGTGQHTQSYDRTQDIPAADKRPEWGMSKSLDERGRFSLIKDEAQRFEEGDGAPNGQQGQPGVAMGQMGQPSPQFAQPGTFPGLQEEAQSWQRKDEDERDDEEEDMEEAKREMDEGDEEAEKAQHLLAYVRKYSQQGVSKEVNAAIQQHYDNASYHYMKSRALIARHYRSPGY